MASARKNAVGMFPERDRVELAMNQLQASGFSMNNVSVVDPHARAADKTLGKLTDPVVESPEDATRDRPIDKIQHGAAGATAIGSVAGGVVAGLTTLAFPAFSGAVVLIGMAAGAFYGAVSGGLLSNEIGITLPEEQAKHYSELLDRGNYLVVLKGTEPDIDRAESILKAADVSEWMVFDRNETASA
jgi:outer membrane lipoprotein SlyB